MERLRERFFKIPTKYRWPALAVLVCMALVALYILDVWLVGTLAAYVAAIVSWMKNLFAGQPNFSLAGWYWQHPFTTARAWLGSSENLSNPGIRTWWLFLNILVLVFVIMLKVQAGKALKNIDYRDIRQVRFKKLRFDLNRQLAKTPRDKYFIALDDQRRPITLPADKMTEHIHILGGSGSGKTSLAVIPLCLQAIRRGSAVIAIDFKGDKQAIQLLAREAQAAGRRFYFFSINSRINSNTYNPLAAGSSLSKVERVMTALDLLFAGEAKFYSYVQQSTFITLLKTLDAMDFKYTLGDIYTILKNQKLFSKLTGEEISENQVKGLTAALTIYADLIQINDPWPDINLEKVMQNGDVCYFDLRSAEAPHLSSSLGKMIAMDLQALAAGRSQLNRLAVVAIDEFQNMACHAFTNIISKVRDANYSMILANQSMGDLKAVSQDFINTVITNTATKMVFNVEEPGDAEYFARRGGKILQEVWSHSNSRQGQNLAATMNGDSIRETISKSKSEMETYFIHPNVISQLPFGKSLIFRRGEVATIGNHVHLISKTEKERLENEPYPEPEPAREKPSGKTMATLFEKAKNNLADNIDLSKPTESQSSSDINAGNVQVEDVAL
ncbi:AAA-like domain-containing protein [Desulfotomaculum arcticum]|uniref:AAA-like domain-containing protein n=1 Tax=Desulfotruncus arcticus DSM 17038 TaxID=1121424 RepID=A0A1I2N1H5_9FIRM|nr:type IV secretory system conjugative DNA transfer family protein [Desulfotruncus arcticus]SFF97503.1 AAA-like domain-containing protein [Desulfotomaculum arcticum] [Desulfotruncus arcticus DSM 17038]